MNVSAFWKWLAAFSLVFGQVLMIYGWGSLSFSAIISGVLLLYTILTRKYKRVVPKWLLVYFGFYILTAALNASTISDIFPLGIILMIICIPAYVALVDLKTLIKAYRIIGVICILFLFFQEIIYTQTGIQIPGVIPGIPLSFGLDGEEFLAHSLLVDRCSSFFREPAHCAQFLLILLTIELFTTYLKHRTLMILLLIVSLLLLQSGNAILGMALVLIIYFLWYIRTKNFFVAKNVFKFFIATTACVIGLLLYVQTEEGEKLLERRESISMSSNDPNASAHMRVGRGFVLYSDLPLLNKVIGLNNQQALNNFTKHSKYSSFFYGDQDNYYNGVSEVLLRTGIIVLFIMFLLFRSLWNRKDGLCVCLISLFVMFSFIAATFFSQLMNLTIVLLLLERKNRLSYLRKNDD